MIVLAATPEDKSGRKLLTVPCGLEVMAMALKALVYLCSRQSQRLVKPNTTRSIRNSRLIANAVSIYQRNLVVGILKTGKDMIQSCIIRNSYTIEEHIRMLLDTWMQHGSTPTLLALREHQALALRHMMLLRDEDLRRLNLSDCFMDQVPNREGGTQNVSMLAISFYRGKTNQDGKTQYGTALRHEDVRRCAVGAMAFYLFARWRVGCHHRKSSSSCFWCFKAAVRLT